MTDDNAQPKRSAPVQQPPPASLSGFPTRDDVVGRPAYRSHQLRDLPDKGCWYFAGHAPGTEPGGRFDVDLPDGTCYLAESPEVAARERVGRFLAYSEPVPATFLEGLVVSTVVLPASAAPVADAMAPDAATHHQVTRELFAGNDYSLTASWAQAVFEDGHGAMLFQPRFSTTEEFAVALFDTSGGQSSRPVEATVLLRTVLDGMSVTVADIPSLVMSQIDDDAQVEDA